MVCLGLCTALPAADRVAGRGWRSSPSAAAPRDPILPSASVCPPSWAFLSICTRLLQVYVPATPCIGPKKGNRNRDTPERCAGSDRSRPALLRNSLAELGVSKVLCSRDVVKLDIRSRNAFSESSRTTGCGRNASRIPFCRIPRDRLARCEKVRAVLFAGGV